MVIGGACTGTWKNTYRLYDKYRLGCITPGTVVRLTDPGQIIPVNSMDAIRFQPIARGQTAHEMVRIAHATALQRAQAGIEQSVARSLAGGQSVSTSAQQQAVLTQQDLERAIDRMAGISRREMGVPQHSPVSQVGQRLQAEQQQRAVSDLELGRLCGSQFLPPPDENIFPSRPTPVYSADYLVQEKKREKAEERAQELLGYMIGEEQIEVYKRTNRLFVKGKKYDYIIQAGGYILQLKKDKVIDLCVHLEKRYVMPLTDDVIAMKLRIENDEKYVLKLANEWGERDRKRYVLPECAGIV